MASVREAIFLMLVGVVLALLVLPCTYFYQFSFREQEVSDYRVHSHYSSGDVNGATPSPTAASGGDPFEEPHQEQCAALSSYPSHGHTDVDLTRRNYMKETVFGGISGLLTMVAVMVGGIGADLTTRHIVAMGMSNLIANAFSMSFKEYVAASAEREFAIRQQAEEYHEVSTRPLEEIREMIHTYQRRGLSEDDALAVATILSKYNDYWVQHMLWEELGVQAPEMLNEPVFSGVAVFLSFAGFGLIPLLGILLPLALERRFGAQWYRPQYSSLVALAISGLTLVLLGGALATYTNGGSAFRSGVLMLLNGCAASGISFSLSQGLLAFLPTPSALSRTDSFDRKTKPAVASASAGQEHVPVPQRGLIVPWPFFRRRFLRGIGLLCLTTSILAFIARQAEFASRMMYESLRVFGYGLFTCITTGVGVLPLVFVECDKVSEAWLASANTIAGGMMLAASAGMLLEGHEVSGPWDWQLAVGVACGVVFIKASQSMLGDEEESGVEALFGSVMERRHFNRAVLIFTVMFCHSAAEGVAVGVAFDRHCEPHFGLYVSLLLAIQNMPEGMAVALALIPKGVDLPLAVLIATLTSVPQPLMAVVAFRFVETCQSLLPVGLAFAAGAMVYVSISDLISEAAPVLGRARMLGLCATSFTVMYLGQHMLEAYMSP